MKNTAMERILRQAFLLSMVSACLLNSSLYAQGNNGLFSFAVVGDVPYGNQALARFPELVQSIENGQSQFVIHVGDIKAGSASCSDAMLTSRLSAINAIKKPVVFIPGDNDWTDCHRRRAGAFKPLDRLKKLRELAYPQVGQSLGAEKMTVDSQASIPGFEEFPEHQRWQQDGVSFVALHVLGSANGLEAFRGRTAADQLEVERRIAATIEWLDSNFEQALAADSSAIVVAVHGNPLNLSKSKAARFTPNPYSGFLDSLKKGALKFRKPVLLIHGDTHDYKCDQPFSDSSKQLISNLYRLEGIGSPAIGWVEVVVKAQPDTQAFVVTPHFISNQ